MNERENWSTLKDVQKYLGVGRESILQWINKRNMPAYKVAGCGNLSFQKWMNGFVLVAHLMIMHPKKRNSMPSKVRFMGQLIKHRVANCATDKCRKK